MEAVATTLIEDGRTTVPPEILDEMGLKGTERVYWTCDGVTATFSLVPEPPLMVRSEEEFWAKVEQGHKDYREGRFCSAEEGLEDLRGRIGLV